jgi:hypothetical protein
VKIMDELTPEQIAEAEAVAQAAAIAVARDAAIASALRDPAFVGSLSLRNGMDAASIDAAAARALGV